MSDNKLFKIFPAFGEKDISLLCHSSN